MRISRSTPPKRSICDTPFTPCSARTTVSSTNQDSSSGVIARRVGDDRQPSISMRVTIGSSMVRGSSARMRDGVLDVVARGLVDLEAELDGLAEALGHRRGLVLDAVDAGNGVLDLLGDLHLELGGRRARLVDAHLHDRHVDIGKAGHRRLAEARSRARSAP